MFDTSTRLPCPIKQGNRLRKVSIAKKVESKVEAPCADFSLASHAAGERCIVLQYLKYQFAKQIHDDGNVLCPCMELILPKNHIKHPVQAVFHRPVLTLKREKLLRSQRLMAEQVISAHFACVATRHAACAADE